jgi:ribosomal protein L35AE/L33A
LTVRSTIVEDERRKKLEAKSGVGKRVWFKDKKTGQRIFRGIVKDEVYIIVGDYKHLI